MQKQEYIDKKTLWNLKIAATTHKLKPTVFTIPTPPQNAGPHFLVGVTLEKNKSSKNKTTPLNQKQPLKVLIVTRPNIVD